jgi:hypothetical protein
MPAEEECRRSGAYGEKDWRENVRRAVEELRGERRREQVRRQTDGW